MPNEFLDPKMQTYPKEEIIKYEQICLNLLQFNLNILSSYDILKFFLVNGLIANTNPTLIDKFYDLSFEILNRFNDDVRSLDFSTYHIAMASLILSSEMISYQFTKSVKEVLLNVYNIKANDFSNAYFVIKK